MADETKVQEKSIPSWVTTESWMTITNAKAVHRAAYRGVQCVRGLNVHPLPWSTDNLQAIGFHIATRENIHHFLDWCCDVDTEHGGAALLWDVELPPHTPFGKWCFFSCRAQRIVLSNPRPIPDDMYIAALRADWRVMVYIPKDRRTRAMYLTQQSALRKRLGRYDRKPCRNYAATCLLTHPTCAVPRSRSLFGARCFINGIPYDDTVRDNQLCDGVLWTKHVVLVIDKTPSLEEHGTRIRDKLIQAMCVHPTFKRCVTHTWELYGGTDEGSSPTTAVPTGVVRHTNTKASDIGSLAPFLATRAARIHETRGVWPQTISNSLVVLDRVWRWKALQYEPILVELTHTARHIGCQVVMVARRSKDIPKAFRDQVDMVVYV